MAKYLKTWHPWECNIRATNQSRESPTKRTLKHYYSAMPVGRLDWSSESRQTLRWTSSLRQRRNCLQLP